MKNLQKFIKNNLLVLLIIFSSLILFSPALNNFFSGDDWFHLKIVQISSTREFVNFFNPVFNEQSTAFYRPIPNQLFFYTFYQLFNLNAFFYHLFVFLIFSFNLYLFFKLSENLNINKKAGFIALVVFAFSHTNFTQLNFISAAQEIMMNFFVLLGLLSSLKKHSYRQYLLTGLYFLLALLCKDNAIVFPVLVIIFDWLKFKKINFKKVTILLIVSAIYLYVRVFLFGFGMTLEGHESYQPNFSPVVVANSMYVYFLWAVGGAELLKDYLSSPISLIQRFYTDFGLLGKIMIGLMIATVSSLVLLTLKNFKKITKMQWAMVIIFITSLLPVLLFPNHKFTMQMSLSMFGFALFIGLLLAKESKKVVVLILFFYLSLNISSIILTYKTHYSVQRSQISHRVYKFFKEEYPRLPDESKIIFLNTNTNVSDVPSWGSSKQISHALMEDFFFKVLYPDTELEILYEDYLNDIELSELENLNSSLDNKILFVDSDLFLQ